MDLSSETSGSSLIYYKREREGKGKRRRPLAACCAKTGGEEVAVAEKRIRQRRWSSWWRRRWWRFPSASRIPRSDQDVGEGCGYSEHRVVCPGPSPILYIARATGAHQPYLTGRPRLGRNQGDRPDLWIGPLEINSNTPLPPLRSSRPRTGHPRPGRVRWLRHGGHGCSGREARSSA